MTDFSAGAVVKLRSGGPAMTVMSVANSQVQCMWFPEFNDNYVREPAELWFMASNLTLIEPAPAGAVSG